MQGALHRLQAGGSLRQACRQQHQQRRHQLSHSGRCRHRSSVRGWQRAALGEDVQQRIIEEQEPVATSSMRSHDDASPSLSSRSDSPSQRAAERQLASIDQGLPRQEAKLEAIIGWVGAAAAFGAGIWVFEGAEKAQEFFAGYLLEQSLSVDNLFVFVLVFSYFKTDLSAQPKVLNYGIATAAVLRMILIVLGTELVQSFKPVLLGFALILLYSAYRLITADGDDDEDLSDNAVVKLCRRFIPVTDTYHGDNFFTLQGGVRMATPLLLTLAVVELSDVVFAVDSIPAVFGVTLDPFIVYTSNIFAILSLRALYTFVSTVMTELRFLDKSVAVVLAFIGTKMVLEFGGLEIPTDVSLLVVGAVLGTGVGASILLPEPREDDV